jgi:uncharacterized protein
MHTIVESRRAEIATLCRQFHVKRLDVFGSAATGNFDPDKSDIDFLVEFEDLEPKAYKNAYFELLFALERVFNRSIDLITAPSLENRVLIENIMRSKEPVYG